jgi:DnaJ-class molecular chaperone
MMEKVETDLHKEFVSDQEVKAKDMNLSLWCTLNEFYFGSKKNVQYTRFSVVGASSFQIGLGA